MFKTVYLQNDELYCHQIVHTVVNLKSLWRLPIDVFVVQLTVMQKGTFTVTPNKRKYIVGICWHGSQYYTSVIPTGA
jgi:hypothetical protein